MLLVVLVAFPPSLQKGAAGGRGATGGSGGGEGGGGKGGTDGGSGVSTSNLGTAVGNNSVARARATSAASGSVLRQPVSRTPQLITWQWPHQGRVIKGFQSGVSKGLDIAGNVGDPVLAAGDGDVVYSGRGIQGSGDLIIVRHSVRYLSAYAHNSRMLVNEGSRVRAGENASA